MNKELSIKALLLPPPALASTTPLSLCNLLNYNSSLSPEWDSPSPTLTLCSNCFFYLVFPKHCLNSVQISCTNYSICVPQFMYKDVHHSALYKKEKLRTTKMPTNRDLVIYIMSHIYMECYITPPKMMQMYIYRCIMISVYFNQIMFQNDIHNKLI